MHANEKRLLAYIHASRQWLNKWKNVEKKITRIPLTGAHKIMIKEAKRVLPFEVSINDDRIE